MVNTELFNKTIKDIGIKKCFVAKELGICNYALIKKIDNRNEFTLKEVQDLREILRIPDELFFRIFFNKETDKLSGREKFA